MQRTKRALFGGAIGKTSDELVEMWNIDHPDNPVKG